MALDRSESERLYAENLELQAEAAMLQELIPQVTPYDGPLPKSWGEFQNRPPAWQRHVEANHPEHHKDLWARQVLLDAAGEHDKAEARRLEVLKDCPVKSVEDFNALPVAEPRKLAQTMTAEQKAALLGQAIPGPGSLMTNPR